MDNYFKNKTKAEVLSDLSKKKINFIVPKSYFFNVGEWKNNLTRYEKSKPIIEKARTIYKVLDKNSICSLVEMKPITGRKHQLRKQLYLIGNPVYGDQKYKFNNTDRAINKNLMLHSYQIRFMINDKKYTYTANLPEYFRKLLITKRLKLPNF